MPRARPRVTTNGSTADELECSGMVTLTGGRMVHNIGQYSICVDTVVSRAGCGSRAVRRGRAGLFEEKSSRRYTWPALTRATRRARARALVRLG